MNAEIQNKPGTHHRRLQNQPPRKANTYSRAPRKNDPAASRHDEYSTHPIEYSSHPINEVPVDGSRVRIVQNKDGGPAHAFRFANWGRANVPLSADFTDIINKAWHAAIPAF
ncbi:hypothetical protein PV726_36985 [Streptomyces europaeiscabiei]|uniref:hypothetical protein n=1 Tax=Streptomyces europaeiscabiei TaxID=146819 RepID=UPI0029B8D416|nr:hypothetical protein [Streptomyces europaeiscabiei]MDX3695817.1 hypothetical protein [Streptomyces europaeiscabiei]